MEARGSNPSYYAIAPLVFHSEDTKKINTFHDLTCGFIEVHIDSLQLKIRVSMVCAGGVNAMFI
jgi:hypothetical protein